MKERLIKIIVLIVFLMVLILLWLNFINKNNSIKVDLTSLTYKDKMDSGSIKEYTLDDYDTFVSDYNNKSLPSIYITDFIYDGASLYKTYDLDDYIENGNSYSYDPFSIKAINVNRTGNIYFTGEISNGTILVNSNDINDDINIILNNVKIDTNNKNIPAIYVYNKDINYTTHQVKIKTQDNSKNYLEGGKIKKVSLIDKNDLNSYSDKYSDDASNWYNLYTSYYGIYTKDEIDRVLFAKVEADREDLEDGDPYYFYKGAGAISSDIDITFEGNGYLEVSSKNKEGIESKGNISFTGASGDYKIVALDDCINTTTGDGRNTITINVNKMEAIVSSDAKEGDAIDSNGTLVIEGGNIIAIAKEGSDFGLDSSKGTYINGGTILATGDMLDSISSDSKQRFISFSFNELMDANSLLVMLDGTDGPLFAYETDRSYRNLVYSSNNISDATYYLYKNGSIEGNKNNGLYSRITSYEKGDQLGYSKDDITLFGEPPQMDGEPPQNNGEPPQMDNMERPPEPPSDGMKKEDEGNNRFDFTFELNNEFTINSISNYFSRISIYNK